MTLPLVTQVAPGDNLGDTAYNAFQKTNAAITQVNVLTNTAALPLASLPLTGSELVQVTQASALTQSTTLAIAGSLNLGSITNYGGVPGVDCTTALTNAAAAQRVVTFPTGAWVINGTPTIAAGVIISARSGATFTGAGAGPLGLDTTSNVLLQTSEAHASSTDL